MQVRSRIKTIISDDNWHWHLSEKYSVAQVRFQHTTLELMVHQMHQWALGAVCKCIPTYMANVIHVTLRIANFLIWPGWNQFSILRNIRVTSVMITSTDNNHLHFIKIQCLDGPLLHTCVLTDFALRLQGVSVSSGNLFPLSLSGSRTQLQMVNMIKWHKMPLRCSGITGTSLHQTHKMCCNYGAVDSKNQFTCRLFMSCSTSPSSPVVASRLSQHSLHLKLKQGFVT